MVHWSQHDREKRSCCVDYDDANDPLGMSESELYQYLNEVLHEEAAEAAAESGKTVEEELDTRAFQMVAAASTYAVKLINANNAFITRQLLDRGVLPSTEDEE
jgi:hypothetical protein